MHATLVFIKLYIWHDYSWQCLYTKYKQIIMKNGFSLIELAICTAIIGILASIAVHQYQLYLARTHVQTETAIAKAPIEKAMAEHIATRGALPGSGFSDLATSGFLQDDGSVHSTTSLATKNIRSIEWNGTMLTLTFINNHEQSRLSGKTIQFTLDSNNTSMEFVSSGGTLASHLWP
jgi:type IV pilus assembly protein PilA